MQNFYPVKNADPIMKIVVLCRINKKNTAPENRHRTYIFY